MKRILIVKKESELKPVGGPAGYLYNLKCGLSSDSKVHFMEESEDVNVEDRGKTSGFKKYVSSKPLLKKMLSNFILLRKVLLGSNTIDKNSLINYDILHFHSTISYYFNRKLLGDFSGKTIVTSHCPKPWHLEFIEDDLSSVERFFYKPFFKLMESVDTYAFNHANYIHFPCIQAEEPYVKNWPEFNEIKAKRPKNFIYFTSGVNDVSATKSRAEVRSKFGIPCSAKVICFVGRHNETKGYDLLKRVAEKVLKLDENTYFLIAGLEHPIKGLDHKNWIEVGWTNEAFNIISASDYFALPNKETFFDLVLLEALSLGSSVILSYTGGNKYFEDLSPDLHFFSTEDEFSDLVYALPSGNEVSHENRKLFLNEYDTDSFAARYIDKLNGNI